VEFIAKEEIKSIVASTMSPDLKASGYRKSAFTWHKLVGDVIKIVNVQLSRYNQLHESQFTINLGIYHEQFHKERGLPIPEKNIKEYDCDVRVRIGHLMGKTDHWWVVAYNKDNEKVKDGVRYNFVKHALPWIEGFGGLANMYDWFAENKRHFDAAIAARLLGRDNVAELVRDALATANSSFAPFVRRWAKQHGIDVEQRDEAARKWRSAEN
jgi:hypothetical protein